MHFEKYFLSRGCRYTSANLEVLGELQTFYIGKFYQIKYHFCRVRLHLKLSISAYTYTCITSLKIINSKIYVSCAILDRELSFEEKKGTLCTPPPYSPPTNIHAILYWINYYNPVINNVMFEYCRFVHTYLIAIFLIYPWINDKMLHFCIMNRTIYEQ